MNLRKQKSVAARLLKVGKDRIKFLPPRLNELKEAITKQDIQQLKQEGAIVVEDKKGRKKVNKKKRKGPGSIKKKVNTRKRDYVILTRKLRKYVQHLKSKGELSREEALDIRKKIRNRYFKNLANLKKYIRELKR